MIEYSRNMVSAAAPKDGGGRNKEISSLCSVGFNLSLLFTKAILSAQT